MLPLSTPHHSTKFHETVLLGFLHQHAQNLENRPPSCTGEISVSLIKVWLGHKKHVHTVSNLKLSYAPQHNLNDAQLLGNYLYVASTNYVQKWLFIQGCTIPFDASDAPAVKSVVSGSVQEVYTAPILPDFELQDISPWTPGKCWPATSWRSCKDTRPARWRTGRRACRWSRPSPARWCGLLQRTSSPAGRTPNWQLKTPGWWTGRWDTVAAWWWRNKNRQRFINPKNYY